MLIVAQTEIESIIKDMYKVVRKQSIKNKALKACKYVYILHNKYILDLCLYCMVVHVVSAITPHCIL